MKLNRNIRGLVLGLSSGVALLSAAHASTVSAQSTASITGLTYRLEDIDPNDGIEPWMTFSGNVELWNMNAGRIFLPVDSLPTTSGSFHGASVTPTSWTSHTEAQKLPLPPRDQWRPDQFSGAGGDSNAVSFRGGDPGLDFSQQDRITLSANTRVVIEGRVQLSSEADASMALSPENVALLEAMNAPYQYQVFTSARFSASLGHDSWWNGAVGVNDIWGKNDSGVLPGQPQSQNLDEVFQLSFTNYASHSSSAYLAMNLQTNAFGSALTSAVPEPATAALMALGLGLMGWRVRGHRALVASKA